MAGIIKRKNKWVAVFRDASRKEVRKTTGVDVKPKAILPGQNMRTVMSQQEAKARLIANEMEARQKGMAANEQVIEALGADAERIHGKKHSSVPVCDYLKEFLSNRSQNAQERDGKAIRQFLGFLGEQKSIAIGKVTRAMTIDFMEKELERVASGTVGRYLKSLSCAFNRAVNQEIIKNSPFTGVTPPKANRKDKQDRKAFTVEQIKTLTSILPGEWSDMIWTCVFTGGQRLGDIACLKWEQVDLDKATICMTTKKAKQRINTPPLPSFLKDIFISRFNDRINEFVFPTAAMKHSQAGGKSSKLSFEFTSLLREHGFIPQKQRLEGNKRELAELSFHSLRATVVTLLNLQGEALSITQHIVGHDSEDVHRGYMKPPEEDIARAMQKLGDAFS